MDGIVDFGMPGVRDGRLRTAWTAGSEPTIGWAWLQHGFARGSRHLAGLAGALAGAHISSVRPDLPPTSAAASLSPRRSMHDTAYLTAVALTVGRAVGTGAGWVGIGHSAGAAVVVHAAAVLAARAAHAARTAAPGAPRGLVLLDPVDTAGGLLRAALPGLPVDLPILALACPPSRCNRDGQTVEWLRRTGRVEVRDLPGLSHADPERIPATGDPADVPPAGRAVRWACGPGGTPEQVVALGEETVGIVRELL